jgi:hypothetical protein
MTDVDAFLEGFRFGAPRSPAPLPAAVAARARAAADADADADGKIIVPGISSFPRDDDDGDDGDDWHVSESENGSERGDDDDDGGDDGDGDDATARARVPGAGGGRPASTSRFSSRTVAFERSFSSISRALPVPRASFFHALARSPAASGSAPALITVVATGIGDADFPVHDAGMSLLASTAPFVTSSNTRFTFSIRTS